MRKGPDRAGSLCIVQARRKIFDARLARHFKSSVVLCTARTVLYAGSAAMRARSVRFVDHT